MGFRRSKVDFQALDYDSGRPGIKRQEGRFEDFEGQRFKTMILDKKSSDAGWNVGTLAMMVFDRNANTKISIHPHRHHHWGRVGSFSIEDVTYRGPG